jgi:DNA topoisomerase I
MELFKMPRDLGLFEEKPVVINIGRFGPYVLHDKKFVSIPKTDDPYEITSERAIELILAKRVADANRLIKDFPGNDEIQILNGRFGPYIKAGKKNVKIPKGKEPASLTLEECIVLADATPEKKGRFGRRAEPKKESVAAPAKKQKAAAETPAKTSSKPKVKAAAKVPAKAIVAPKKAAKKISAPKKVAKKAAKKTAAKKKPTR